MVDKFHHIDRIECFQILVDDLMHQLGQVASETWPVNLKFATVSGGQKLQSPLDRCRISPTNDELAQSRCSQLSRFPRSDPRRGARWSRSDSHH